MRWIAISALSLTLAGSLYVNRNLSHQLDQRGAELAQARAELEKQRTRSDDAIAAQEERIEKLKDTLADEQGKLEISENRVRAASTSRAFRDQSSGLEAQIDRQHEVLLRLQDKLRAVRDELSRTPRPNDEAGEVDPAIASRHEADELRLEIRQEELMVHGLEDRARDLRETGDPADANKARGLAEQARDQRELLVKLRIQRRALLDPSRARVVAGTQRKYGELRRAEEALAARYEMERQGYTELLSRLQSEGTRREAVQAAMARVVAEYRNQQLRVEHLAQDLEQQERRLSALRAG